MGNKTNGYCNARAYRSKIMKHTQYVMGLIFDTTDRILLIKKKRPTHQVGKWNGLGGKVEDNESITAAMSREVKEESNLDIPETSWTLMYSGSQPSGSLFVFITYISPELMDSAKQMTDEIISVFSISELPLNCMEDIYSYISSRSKRKPKVLLITGAHNNEEYAKYLVDNTSLLDTLGVTVRTFSMNLEDTPVSRDISINLNRIKDHEMVYNLAQKLNELYALIKQYDVIIDIHNSQNIENLNLISFSDESDLSFKDWASNYKLKTDFVYRRTKFNTISGYARDNGKIAVTCEINGMNPFGISTTQKNKDTNFLIDTIYDCVEIFMEKISPSSKSIKVFDESKILYEITPTKKYSELNVYNGVVKLKLDEFTCKEFPKEAYSDNVKFKVFGIEDFYKNTGFFGTCESKVQNKDKISFLIKK